MGSVQGAFLKHNQVLDKKRPEVHKTGLSSKLKHQYLNVNF